MQSFPKKFFFNFLFDLNLFQRPTAKELLRHTFIKKAKRTTYLTELIERYRDWKLRGGAGQQSESDSSSDDDNANDTRHDSGGWIETIRDRHNVLLNENNNNNNNNLKAKNSSTQQTTTHDADLVAQPQHMYSSNGNSHKINPTSSSFNNINNNNTNHFYKSSENDSDEEDQVNGARNYQSKLNDQPLFARSQNVLIFT